MKHVERKDKERWWEGWKGRNLAAVQAPATPWTLCLKCSREREASGCCMIEVEAKILWDAGVEVPYFAQYHHPNNKCKHSAHCSCLLICLCYHITYIPWRWMWDRHWCSAFRDHTHAHTLSPEEGKRRQGHGIASCATSTVRNIQWRRNSSSSSFAEANYQPLLEKGASATGPWRR